MSLSKQVLDELYTLEKKYDVTILMAIESGSRAWGFPSPDSDYDVRFIYVHKPDWYLSTFPKRDVIERPVDPILDISGWELRKSLQLLSKSNGALIEWINSPITYKQHAGFRRDIQSLQRNTLNPTALFYHYLSMANNKKKSILESDTARLKDYFYLLRAVFCCHFIRTQRQAPPMLFSELLEHVNTTYHLSLELNNVIADWLTHKQKANETTLVKKHNHLDKWAVQLLNDCENDPPTPFKMGDYGAFDKMLIKYINTHSKI